MYKHPNSPVVHHQSVHARQRRRTNRSYLKSDLPYSSTGTRNSTTTASMHHLGAEVKRPVDSAFRHPPPPRYSRHPRLAATRARAEASDRRFRVLATPGEQHGRTSVLAASSAPRWASAVPNDARLVRTARRRPRLRLSDGSSSQPIRYGRFLRRHRRRKPKRSEVARLLGRPVHLAGHFRGWRRQ